MTTSIIAKLYRGPSPSSSFLPARQSLADCSSGQQSKSRFRGKFAILTTVQIQTRRDHPLTCPPPSFACRHAPARLQHCTSPYRILDHPSAFVHSYRSSSGTASHTHLNHPAGDPASSIHCCGLHPARDTTLTVCFCFYLKDPPPGQLLVRSTKVDCRLTRLQLAQELLAAAKQSYCVCDMMH